jgi:hypothetical protein
MKKMISTSLLNMSLLRYVHDVERKMYTPEVTDELLRFAKKESKPVRKVEVPVYDFAMNQ